MLFVKWFVYDSRSFVQKNWVKVHAPKFAPVLRCTISLLPRPKCNFLVSNHELFLGIILRRFTANTAEKHGHPRFDFKCFCSLYIIQLKRWLPISYGVVVYICKKKQLTEKTNSGEPRWTLKSKSKNCLLNSKKWTELFFLYIIYIVLFSKRFGSGPKSVELTALLFIRYNEHFLGLHLSVIEKTTSVEHTFSLRSTTLVVTFTSCFIPRYSGLAVKGGYPRPKVWKTHTAHDAYKITHM